MTIIKIVGNIIEILNYVHHPWKCMHAKPSYTTYTYSTLKYSQFSSLTVKCSRCHDNAYVGTWNNVRNGARKILWPFFIWCLCTLDSLGSLSRYRCLSAVHTNECACISYILSEPFRMELCGALFWAIMTVNDNIGDSFRNNGFRL